MWLPCARKSLTVECIMFAVACLERQRIASWLQVDSLELKRRYSPYVEQCVMLLKSKDVTADLFVEVLGTLANLCVPEFDFQALAQRHDLLDFLAQFAQPGAVDDDILLEVVMFLGAHRTLLLLGCGSVHLQRTPASSSPDCIGETWDHICTQHWGPL